MCEHLQLVLSVIPEGQYYALSSRGSRSTKICATIDAAITAGLGGATVYVVGEGLSAPTAGELTILDNWVTAGGRLLLFNNSGCSGCTATNAILTALGSGISVSGTSAVVAPFQRPNAVFELPAKRPRRDAPARTEAAVVPKNAAADGHRPINVRTCETGVEADFLNPLLKLLP